MLYSNTDSSDFLPIARRVVGVHEGGLSEHKADKGLITNYGISLRFLKGVDLCDGDITGDGHVNREDILAMTLDEAYVLYRKYFWDHYNVDQFQVYALKEKMFSLLINMRGKQAMKCMQRAIRTSGIYCIDDGIFGSASKQAFSEALSSEGAGESILAALKSEAAGVYRLIVAANLAQKVFLNGWLNRAYD